MGIIQRIREKQDASKARYAFVGAIIVTVFVGTVWASTLPARFSGVIPEKDLGASLLESASLDTLFPEQAPNTDEVPLFPTTEVTPLEDGGGALGELGTDWRDESVPVVVSATSTTESAPTPPKPILVVPTAQIVATTTQGGATNVRVATATPQVIRIATTTSQGSP